MLRQDRVSSLIVLNFQGELAVGYQFSVDYVGRAQSRHNLTNIIILNYHFNQICLFSILFKN